jgi:hypothetical protein
MGLQGKFSPREAELPENFLPRGKQSFPGEAKLPQNFKGSKASQKFSKGKCIMMPPTWIAYNSEDTT